MFFQIDLDVGILINNAAEFQHEGLDEISPDNLLRASVVNCHAPALLARYFIPKMVQRHQNVRSIIEKNEGSYYYEKINLNH